MYMFMTTGTLLFLQTVTDKHPKHDFYYMKSGTSTLVLYESHKKKGIFVSGRAYEVLHDAGSLQLEGFVAMDVVPVKEDTMRVFEERVAKILPKLQQMTGLVALRFMKQVKSNQYMILTQWESEAYYDRWKTSINYEETNILSLALLPAYFAERPFTNLYKMIEEDED